MNITTDPDRGRGDLCLVDGSGFTFRAFYALPLLTREDGTPVNAVLGFTNMLMKLLDDTDADHIAVLFDTAHKTFRHDIYSDYKANRPDPPEELVPQFPLVREATRALNLPCIEMPGFEADDLIATYARQAAESGLKVTIISSDKDMMQLVSDRVTMFDPMKNRRIGCEQVMDIFGVNPNKVVDVQALAGDSVDNVPGVPGIGVKTAALLINEYGDLETLLARADEIKQNKRRQNLLAYAEMARLSRLLVTLRDDVPVKGSLESFARRDFDPETLLQFLMDQNFKSLVAKVQSRLTSAGVTLPTVEGSPPTADAVPTEVDYELVQTLPLLQDWVNSALDSGLVAVSIQTTICHQSRAELVGVSLSTQPGRACYIPLIHRVDASSGDSADAPGLPSQVQMDKALEVLASILSDPSVLKVGHNIKYDMVVLARHGIVLAPVDDIMLLSYVLEGGSHEHDIDRLAELHLGITIIKRKDVTGGGKSQVTFDHVPFDKALTYAAERADLILRLHRLLKPRLVTEHMTTVYETLERPLIPVLAAMEGEGVKVNRVGLNRLIKNFAQRLEALEEEIQTLAGCAFNVGSPRQLGEVLFEKMGIKGGKKGKSGAYGTGAEVLETLAAEGHDLPARVLDWRHLNNLKSTSDGLVAEISPRTERVHTNHSMAAAATGRLASSDPNLQNIPIRTEEGRKIRRAFVTDEGRQLLALDYSQIELRLLAHIAEIDVLKQAFREGLDIHAITASQVYGVPVQGMDPALRRKAKAINFGIIYGISDFGLARQLGVAQAEAAAYIKSYFKSYPGIQDYMERTKTFCRANGYVQTLFGRRCHVPGIHHRNPMVRNNAERSAINAIIQGSAADILKRAMIRIPTALARNGLVGKAKMVLTVHDELVLDVEKAAVDRTTEVVRSIMETAALPAVALDVPLSVDVGVGDTWDEAH